MSTTNNYELLLIPLEAVIGFKNVISRRNSLKSTKSSVSTSPTPSTTNKSNTSILEELRYKFEEYISSGELQAQSLVNLQKLQFLDWFYDSKKKKPINPNQHEVFSMCNSFISELIHQNLADEGGLMIQENHQVEFPFLKQF